MITPPYLKKGDNIGIVAPACKIDKKQIESFLKVLDLWGIKWITGNRLFGEHFIFSGTEEERTADMQEMIGNPDIRAIFCARGGLRICKNPSEC